MAGMYGTEIDTGLMEELRRVAEEEGRSVEEVLEDAVRFFVSLRSYFTEGSRTGSSRTTTGGIPGGIPRAMELKGFLEEVALWQRQRGVEPLSDEEAMRLAVEEQHAFRREG